MSADPQMSEDAQKIPAANASALYGITLRHRLSHVANAKAIKTEPTIHGRKVEEGTSSDPYNRIPKQTAPMVGFIQSTKPFI